jgi:hypothetical protein
MPAPPRLTDREHGKDEDQPLLEEGSVPTWIAWNGRREARL